MGGIKVLDGGLFTTIQDIGRVGYRKFGVPTSGAIDIKSYNLSNWLVGNREGSPVLELTLNGGRYQFESNAIVAITGALMNPRVNGKKAEMNRSLKVNRDDELEMSFSTRGCRAYLAIRGELRGDNVMDSLSTYTLGKFGGFEGRILQSGDKLEWTNHNQDFDVREVPKNQIPYYSSKVCVRIAKGIEWDWFDEDTKNKFLNLKFEVNSKSNRMGIRLEGEPLTTPIRQLASSPVIPGVIQLPPNGNPIILMQDGQTIGGYPRIAKVTDQDLWRLGQLKPGDSLSFEELE